MLHLSLLRYVFYACIFLQLVSELSVEDLGEPVYAWELPGVAGNACNGLTPTVALQLAAVVYGANLFSVLLRLGSCMVTGMPVNPSFRLGIVIVCSWFVWQMEHLRSVEDQILLQTLGLQSCEMFEGEEQWLTLVESEVFEGILRFDGRKLEEVSRHHQLQPTEVA
eukprot:Gb_22598 [translate_table: standard]